MDTVGDTGREPTLLGVMGSPFLEYVQSRGFCEIQETSPHIQWMYGSGVQRGGLLGHSILNVFLGITK